jgi:hypothetical protein
VYSQEEVLQAENGLDDNLAIPSARGHAWANEFVGSADVIARVSVAEIVTTTYGNYSLEPPPRPTSTAYWFRGVQNTLYRVIRLEAVTMYKTPSGWGDEYVVAVPISTVSDQAWPPTEVLGVGDDAVVYLNVIHQYDPLANLLAETASQFSSGGDSVHAMSVGRHFAVSGGQATLVSFPTETYPIGTLENILEVALGVSTPAPGATPFGR